MSDPGTTEALRVDEAANDAYLTALAGLLHDTRDSTWQVRASMVAEYARRYDPTRKAYGDRQREQELRDVAARLGRTPEAALDDSEWARGYRGAAMHAVAVLTIRADEIHGRQPST